MTFGDFEASDMCPFGRSKTLENLCEIAKTHVLEQRCVSSSRFIILIMAEGAEHIFDDLGALQVVIF